MADNNETSTFKLDLDASKFIEEALHAKGAIDNIGKSEGVTELIEGLAKAAPLIGALGLAFYAVKSAIEIVFDAEKIKLVNAQFQQLTHNVGIYGETFKEAMKKAADGMIDDVSLMQATNKSMAELEGGVEKLPQLMELARKATKIFGGDAVENFNAMSMAVASGTTRQLRHLGIVLDQSKVMRDYAKSIGETVSSLSLAGRQQAVLNAALEEGNKKLNVQSADVTQSITAWAQVKVTMTEIKDTIVLAFDKIAGPTVANFFKNLKSMADDAKTYIQDKFGSGAEQSTAHLERTRAKIMEIKGALIDIDQKQLKGMGDAFDASKVIAYTVQLKRLEAELPKTQALVTANAEKEREEAEKVSALKTQISTVETEKKTKEAVESSKALQQIDQHILQEQLKNIQTIDAADKAYAAHKLSEGRAVDQQIAEIQSKESEGLLKHTQAMAQIERLNSLKDLRMRHDDAELEKERIKALDNYLAHSQGVAQGVGRAFEVQSAKSRLELHSTGEFGKKAMSGFSSSAVSSLQAWGSGSKSAGDAVASMFGQMAGGMASQYGELMMLAAIWPPNPPAFIGGAALVALGGFLSSLGGGGSSMPAGGGGSPPSTSSPAIEIPSASASMPSSQAATASVPHKSVSIVIQGHMMMNDQTSRWLVDQIRSAADATDFHVQNATGPGL